MDKAWTSQKVHVFLVTFYIYSSIINELKSFAETRKD